MSAEAVISSVFRASQVSQVLSSAVKSPESNQDDTKEHVGNTGAGPAHACLYNVSESHINTFGQCRVSSAAVASITATKTPAFQRERQCGRVV